MNERDRLAADLHERNDHLGPVCDGCNAMADHLIALGWTRLDEEPEEGLPRTLVPLDSPYVGAVLADDPVVRVELQDILTPLATAIAKAYREDTDA